MTSAPWTGHSGAGPELRLLPLTPELFSPDPAIWLSEELMSQDWHSFATPQLCTDDLGSGECEVSIRHWDPVFSRINFYSPWAGSILSNQTHKSWEKQINKPTACSWSWLSNWNMSQAMVWKLLFSRTEAWTENLTVSELHFRGRVSEEKSRRICRVSLEWLNSKNLYLMLVRMWIPHLRVWKLQDPRKLHCNGHQTWVQNWTNPEWNRSLGFKSLEN